jgi:hypothetical protein
VGGLKSGQPVFGPRHLVDVVVVTGRVFSEAGVEKIQPSGFFLGFLVFIWVFWVFYIFALKREILGFFQFHEYFLGASRLKL